MKNLIVMCAPPGAGKSTLAKQYEVAGYFRVTQDEMGKEGHLEYFKSELNRGTDIIVDRMGFSREQRERYLKPAREAGYKTKIVVLHVPLRICLDRCNARKDHPTVKTPQDASKAVNFFFSKYERVEDGEADEVERIYNVAELDKQPAVIFDVDGTLANIDHRLNFVKNKDTDSERTQKTDWKNFFANIPGDTVNVWCKEIMKKFIQDYTVVVCSGRPEDYKRATVDWLKDNEVPYNAIYMRMRGDYRKDDIVKEIILEFELKTRYNILFSIDDRSQVVKMWRKHGIVCLQCAHGDY